MRRRSLLTIPPRIFQRPLPARPTDQQMLRAGSHVSDKTLDDCIRSARHELAKGGPPERQAAAQRTLDARVRVKEIREARRREREPLLGVDMTHQPAGAVYQGESPHHGAP